MVWQLVVYVDGKFQVLIANWFSYIDRAIHSAFVGGFARNSWVMSMVTSKQERVASAIDDTLVIVRLQEGSP
jgi:hypothetical protein